MRRLCAILAGGVLMGAVVAQAQTPATQPGLDDAAKQLSSDDFRQRQAAVKQIQKLLAEQVAKRAEIQQALNDLQDELSQQIQTLALTSDPEAQTHSASLLEMERGLTTWAIEVMAEPAASRKAILAWGLSKERAPLLAKMYGRELKVRVQSVAELAKLHDEGEGVDWTLARLVNDKAEPAMRTAAIAGLYDRKPTAKTVAALWYRAIVGPGTSSASESNEAPPTPAADNPAEISIPFPGRDAAQFGSDDEDDFSDAVIATDVLVHMNTPLAGDRIKAYIAERKKTEDGLSGGGDNAWALNVHHLIEAYQVKDAAPLLVQEAVKSNFGINTDEVGGRAFIWTDRTIAIGVLLKLDNADPTTLGLLHVTNSSNGNDWLWAAANKNDEEQVVHRFQDWWKNHYKDFGMKESDASGGDAGDNGDNTDTTPPPPAATAPVEAP